MVNQQLPDGKLFELALFAGAGGGILGGKLLGWETVGAVEREPYAASVLVARQNDGLLPPFPIWDDVQTFRTDNSECAGFIEFLRSISDRLVISGGFPCQDISCAGKGAGITGERSGLWKEFARIIGEIRPAYAFIENSPMLITRGLDVVLSDLAALRYDAEWGVLSAADVGALHKRERVWIVARQREFFSHAEYKRSGRWQQFKKGVEKENGFIPDSKSARARQDYRRAWKRIGRVNRRERTDKKIPDSKSIYAQRQHNESWQAQSWRGDWWKAEPDVDRVVDGMAARVDRLKAIGNGQVPLCAATAFRLLRKRIEN